MNGERDGGNGGALNIKLKGQQEFFIIDIDPKGTKGKLVTGALLHIRPVSSKKKIGGLGHQASLLNGPRVHLPDTDLSQEAPLLTRQKMGNPTGLIPEAQFQSTDHF